MRLLSTVAIIIAGAAGLLAACGKSGGGNTGGGSTGTITCDPGENIFCRCPGGEAGTKTCRADGHSFDECVTREGPCPDIPDTTSSSSTSSSSTSSSTSGGGMGGMGTGGSGPAGFLYPCGKDTDCETMKCRYGYCTMDCAKFDECTLGVGECIKFGGEQICMPVCTSTSDCAAAYAEPSACGYTTAVDGTPVTTCADWLMKLAVPPEGSNCTDDIACNLGNEGVQAVCSFETCTKGCYVQSDCPTNTTCSSNGSTLGSCN